MFGDSHSNLSAQPGFPRVSVIVPVRDGGQTIKACLHALFEQSVSPIAYEVILVDDGSTDETVKLVKQLVRQYAANPQENEAGARLSVKVTFIQQEHRGPAAARNLGASQANGELLLFTDSDCEPAVDWIENMITPFADPEVAAVKGCYRTRQQGLMPRFVQLEYESKYDRLRHFDYIPFVDSYSAAYRKPIFEAAGGFDTIFPIPSAEDIDLSFRLASLGYKMIFAPDAIVYHHHNETLLDYMRRKFAYGYWRVLVYRRYPGRVMEDAHTPQAQKLQVCLIPLLLFLLASTFFWKPAWLLVGIFSGLFWLAALPLIARAGRADIHLGIIAPFVLLLRDMALACGLVTGIIAYVQRQVRTGDLISRIGMCIRVASMIGLILLISGTRLASAWFNNRGTLWLIHSAVSPGILSSDRELFQQRAEFEFQRALKLNIHFYSAIRQLGQIQFSKGQYQLAATTLSPGCELGNDPLCHLLLAQTYDALGQNQMAVYEWRQAGASGRYFANFSNATLQEGDPQAALAYAVRALEIDPTCAWAYRSAGKAYQALGNNEQAIHAYETGLTLSSQLTYLEHAQLHRDLGRLLLSTGFPADAIIHFRESIRLAPSESEAYTLMGMAYQASGDVEQAIQWYQKAIQVNPKDEFAPIYLAELCKSWECTTNDTRQYP